MKPAQIDTYRFMAAGFIAIGSMTLYFGYPWVSMWATSMACFCSAVSDVLRAMRISVRLQEPPAL